MYVTRDNAIKRAIREINARHYVDFEQGLEYLDFANDMAHKVTDWWANGLINQAEAASLRGDIDELVDCVHAHMDW